MTHQEHPSVPGRSLGSPGLTRRDVLLVAALVGGLALGLLFDRELASRKRASAATSTPVPAQTTPTGPELASVGDDVVAPAAPSMTPASPAETAPPAAAGTPSSTTTSSATPPSPQPPRNSAGDSGSPEIGRGSPTPPLTSTPTITASATRKPPTRRPPQPATLVYVRSDGRAHALGKVTSGGDLIGDTFHDFARAPAWSPDGKTIAFFGEIDIRRLGGVYKNGEGLWSIGVDGSNPKRLFGIDAIHNIAWSPDGNNLAFEIRTSTAPANEVIVTGPEGQVRSRFNGEQPAWTSDSGNLVVKTCMPDCGLWKVSFEGACITQLTFNGNDSFPALSPDGKTMAFSSDRDGDWEIYLLKLGTKDPTRLTRRAGVDTTPVFSRDGRNIYLRTNAFGDWRITVMALDGSNERVVLADVGPSDDWGAARPAVY